MIIIFWIVYQDMYMLEKVVGNYEAYEATSS